jgi:hypothetical protein
MDRQHGDLEGEEEDQEDDRQSQASCSVSVWESDLEEGEIRSGHSGVAKKKLKLPLKDLSVLHERGAK